MVGEDPTVISYCASAGASRTDALSITTPAPANNGTKASAFGNLPVIALPLA